MSSETELAALLCSRLCHDLLSPVSAMNNGFELLSDESDPDLRHSYLGLVEQSARASTAKLQFYRLAFGAAGGVGDTVPSAEAHDLLAALVAEGKGVELDWTVDAPSLTKPSVKVLLNLAAIGLAALPRGGTLAVGAESVNSSSEIVVRASGPRIAFDPAVGRALEGAMRHDDLSSQTAPAHMICLLTRELGGNLQYMQSADALIMGAVLPVHETAA
jgi:histidine phosphotransferase ChpT